MKYLNLNVDKKFLSRQGSLVLNAEEDLVLNVVDNGQAFMSFKDKHIACILFQDRTYLYEGSALLVYKDEAMIVDDNDSNIDISFLAQDGTFNYVIEKTAITLPFYFELGDKRFELTDNLKIINPK